MNKQSFNKILAIILILTMFLGVQASVKAEDATATPVSDPFTLTFDSTSRSGVPGSIVKYSLTITNNSAGSPADFSIAISSIGGWTPAPSVDTSSVTLNDGETSAAITIFVPVPSSASAGQDDIQSVSVTSGGITKTWNLTTKVNSANSGRPILLVNAYYINAGKAAAGSTMELAVEFYNSGSAVANNVVVSFDGGTSFYLNGTGGVTSVQNIDPGHKFTAKQQFSGAAELAWLDIATIKVDVSYTDSLGTPYTGSFNLTLNSSGGGSYSYATATPAASFKPQIVVTSYKTDVDILQPGTTFDLALDVRNLGTADATAVTMVLGGGATSGGSDNGTPQAGGVSGSGGDLSVFAPLNSSNLVYLGDIKKDAVVSLNQKLIVNVTAQPGVYTLKISFVYTDAKGNNVVDDQVITLLVYSLPQVDVNFYRDAGDFMVGNMGILPLQVTNLGKKTSVLGNMTVTADGADVTNNVSLVGALDPGGYYTLDTNIIPMNEGPLDVKVTINYTDDFNQPRTVEKTISINVIAAPEITSPDMTLGPDGKPIMDFPTETAPETFWQKVGRFFKGLFGLDSSPSNNNGSGATEPPVDNSAPIITGGKG